ncbi:hypothetical protein [Polyangium jinanense]|uniref:NlpC/P60 domain-containing protein n=2 Tax=Polyangium jinanense TaxID=2829994 RepID=A0A9X3X8A2_9BACT|nr:hypothetical protein [Polyangium jinanense]MDC3983191.1 hypothetical protein [Polyangium jinanense]
MAKSLSLFRSSAALLPCVTAFASLSGCMFDAEELHDIAQFGLDRQDEGDDESKQAAFEEEDVAPDDVDAEKKKSHGNPSPQAGAACTTVATFKYATSGDVTTASINSTVVAWFTKGAYTVRMTGPSRTFSAGVTGVPSVTTTMWIRTLATPFDPVTMGTTVRSAWLNAARAVNCVTGTSDILAVAYEYIEGGSNHAGYASGADFHDYLGLSWDPADGNIVAPDSTQIGKVDCSGFLRLIFGFRANFLYGGVEAKIPMSWYVTGTLTRASKDQYQSGPGKIIVPFRTQPTGAVAFNGTPTAAELSAIQVGDIVFFDSGCDYSVSSPSCGTDWTTIGHTGIYVGRDSSNNARFLSSRSTADGPTVANTGGWSVFNDAAGISGTYPKRFRAARRF